MKDKKIILFLKPLYNLFFVIVIFSSLLFLQLQDKRILHAQQLQPETLEELRNSDPNELAKLSVFDSRKYNIITSVKDQGSSNLCWSYTMMAVSEASILRQGLWDTNVNGELDLNEHNNAFVTLNNDGSIDPLELTPNDKIGIGIYNSGYNTGLAFQRALSTWKSPSMEEPSNQYHDALFKLEDIIQVDATDHKAIKRAIAKYGAVTVGYAPHYYATDYYYNDNAITSGKNDRHAVTIVGWDDTIPAENYNKRYYNKETLNGGWIVKNSWGAYGIGKGFFYMSYSSKLRNINAVKYAPADKYDFNYHYDSNGDNYDIYTHDENQKFEKYANIFPVKKSSISKKEMLKAVNVGFSHPNTTVSVDIYTNVNAISGDVKNLSNNPENGTKVITLNKKFEDAGNYTIPLETPLELEANTFFSIVVTLTNSNKKSHVLGSTENLNSNNDMSYVYTNNNWKSTKYYQDNSALRIKAFTKLEDRNTILDKDLKFANIKFNRAENYRYKDVIDNSHFSLYSDGQLLEFNKDYTFNLDDIRFDLNPPQQSISDNQHIGNVTITFRGMGEWKGIKTINLPVLIGHLDASNLTGFTKDPDNPRKASITVGNNITNTSQIVLPLNYIFISNIDLKDGINTTGIVYKGSDELCWRNTYFEITIIKEKSNSTVPPQPKNISELEISFSDEISNLIYNGNQHRPSVIVKDNGKILTINTDYTLTYESNIEPGTANVIIQCIGKYEGRVTKNFIINKIINSISNFSLDANNTPHADVVYDIPTFKYFKDEQGKVEISESDTKLPGVYYVKAFSKDTNHYQGQESSLIRFEVIKDKEIDNLTDCVITIKETNFVYNGLKHEPNVTITLNGKTLTDGFSISYSSNINAGFAKISVLGDNVILTGLKQISFEIKKAINTINVEKIDNKFDVKTKFGKEYQIKYYSDLEGKNEIEKPVKPGKYYQRFISESNENYESDSSDTYEYVVEGKLDNQNTGNESNNNDNKDVNGKKNSNKDNKIKKTLIITFSVAISVILVSTITISLIIKKKNINK